TSGPPDSTQIRNFRLNGDGFGANGSLDIGKGGLISADFDSVKLSSLDDFNRAMTGRASALSTETETSKLPLLRFTD
ncbi:hypothetical protein ACC739_38275, partial [Rhizobium ruizarguesonis]